MCHIYPGRKDVKWQIGMSREFADNLLMYSVGILIRQRDLMTLQGELDG